MFTSSCLRENTCVDDDVIAITKNTVQSGTAGALLNTDPNDPRPQNLFTSISVYLSRLESVLRLRQKSGQMSLLVLVPYYPILLRKSENTRCQWHLQ